MSKDCIICGSNIPPHTTEEGVVYWEGYLQSSGTTNRARNTF